MKKKCTHCFEVFSELHQCIHCGMRIVDHQRIEALEKELVFTADWLAEVGTPAARDVANRLREALSREGHTSVGAE